MGNAPDLPCNRPLRGCMHETVLAAALSLARIHPQLSRVVQDARQCVLSARIDKIEPQIPPQLGKRGICCWLVMLRDKSHTLERPLRAISAKSNQRAHLGDQVGPPLLSASLTACQKPQARCPTTLGTPWRTGRRRGRSRCPCTGRRRRPRSAGRTSRRWRGCRPSRGRGRGCARRRGPRPSH